MYIFSKNMHKASYSNNGIIQKAACRLYRSLCLYRLPSIAAPSCGPFYSSTVMGSRLPVTQKRKRSQDESWAESRGSFFSFFCFLSAYHILDTENKIADNLCSPSCSNSLSYEFVFSVVVRFCVNVPADQQGFVFVFFEEAICKYCSHFVCLKTVL